MMRDRQPPNLIGANRIVFVSAVTDATNAWTQELTKLCSSRLFSSVKCSEFGTPAVQQHRGLHHRFDGYRIFDGGRWQTDTLFG
jgi:hypothetical protein